MNEFRFSVTGDCDFPIDMLRRDRCFPDTERESYRTTHSGMRTVVLRTICRGDAGWRPNEEAWVGAGWRVESGSLECVQPQVNAHDPL